MGLCISRFEKKVCFAPRRRCAITGATEDIVTRRYIALGENVTLRTQSGHSLCVVASVILGGKPLRLDQGLQVRLHPLHSGGDVLLRKGHCAAPQTDKEVFLRLSAVWHRVHQPLLDCLPDGVVQRHQRWRPRWQYEWRYLGCCLRCDALVALVALAVAILDQGVLPPRPPRPHPPTHPHRAAAAPSPPMIDTCNPSRQWKQVPTAASGATEQRRNGVRSNGTTHAPTAFTR